jgi:hypothetical protein
MNTVPTMKLIALLSRLAALGLATFVAGLLLNSHAPALFSVSVGAFILLIVAGDYAPHTSRQRRPVGTVVNFAATTAASQASSENLAA